MDIGGHRVDMGGHRVGYRGTNKGGGEIKGTIGEHRQRKHLLITKTFVETLITLPLLTFFTLHKR